MSDSKDERPEERGPDPDPSADSHDADRTAGASGTGERREPSTARDAAGAADAPSPDEAHAAWRGRVLGLAAAAVALRLLLFLGRGDYLAFDEGWYLLLARSLFTGEGYSLIGIPHVALSPLFPILAGAVGTAIDSWVWGGRIVAAVASGLLVLPAWSIFRRLAPLRTAFIGAALVAVLPSMAPFVVAFWIGADLWVGAEPLLHLFVYLGVALWLRADEADGLPFWPLAGAAFALAYLARPEAIITWGLLGVIALGIAVVRRAPRRLAGALLLGVGFALVASPYWLFLHGATGHWSLTGRGIAPASTHVRAATAGSREGPASTIERMLWADDESYEQRLYALDSTGLRLRDPYWGVYPGTGPAEPGTGEAADPARAGPQGPTPPDTPTTAPDTSTTTPDPAVPEAGAASDSAAGTGPATGAAERPSTAGLYARALHQVFPLLLWVFVILGVARPRAPGVLRRELPVAAALVGTSVAIAAVVAVDPRTQLVLVPLLALYAARGFRLVEEVVRDRLEGAELRPGFTELALAGIAILWLLAIDGQRLYVSLVYGSPHHIVAAQNRGVAEELDVLLAERPGPVASWHPAIAVYADRDWRVVPFAPLGEVIRYAQAAGADGIVLSAYYPPDVGVERLDTRYLVMPVPRGGTLEAGWRLEVTLGDTIRAVGRLTPMD